MPASFPDIPAMPFWIAIRSIISDRAFLIATAVAAASLFALFEARGGDAVRAALADDVHVFAVLVVLLPAMLLLSAIVEELLPRGLVERWLGVGSGFKGIVVATFAGAFTPGGPFVSFPLVLALYRAGADWAPLVAYITSWSILSVVRTLVFEIPIVGIELPTVRYLACIILPPIAGITARYIARFYHPPPGERDR